MSQGQAAWAWSDEARKASSDGSAVGRGGQLTTAEVGMAPWPRWVGPSGGEGPGPGRRAGRLRVAHRGFVSWGPHSHPVPRQVAGAGSGGGVLGWGAHARTEPRLAREEGDWPGGFLELSPAVPELSPSRPQAGGRAGSCPSLGTAEPQGFPSWQETQLLFFLLGSLFCERFSQAVCWITGPGEPAGRRLL